MCTCVVIMQMCIKKKREKCNLCNVCKFLVMVLQFHVQMNKNRYCNYICRWVLYVCKNLGKLQPLSNK